MSEAPAQAKGGKSLSSKIVSNLIIVTSIVTMLSALFIFLGMGFVMAIFLFGFAPSFSAYVFDRHPKRYSSKTIIAFNIAGMLPHASSLLKGNNPDIVAQSMLSDPFLWLTIYGFAGFGWVIVHIIPQIAFLILMVRSEYTVKKLRFFQEQLVEEWGEAITDKKRR